MKTQKIQSSRFVRGSVWTLFVVLIWLFLILYGFLFQDFREAPAPDYSSYLGKYVKTETQQESDRLTREIENCGFDLTQRRETGRNYKESTATLQQTIKQMLDAKIENQLLTNALKEFSTLQTKQGENNQLILDLTAKKQSLERELRSVHGNLESQRSQGQKEYNQVYSSYRMKVALAQLAILLPLLGLSLWASIRYRGRLGDKPIFAFAAATLIQTAVTMHEYFPSRFFKYVLIAVLIGAAVAAIVFLLRMQLKPRQDYLLKKFRQAYDLFVCPVCNHPIRVGVRRFLTRTRKDAVPQVPPGCDNEEYICPNCGEPLFGKCEKCGKIRHLLLPFCEHCGAETDPTKNLVRAQK